MNDKQAWDPEKINKILPVDKYVGGAEHACMHLLYARFFTKAFYDMGLVNFDEPFKSLVHQGVILGPDGEKMSKSRGNVISPDTYVSKFGSDAFRMYLGFGFSYVEGGPWNDDGIKAVNKYIDRVERLWDKIASKPGKGTVDKECNFILHNTIKSVTQDLEVFSFNTAIARMMELTNALYKYTDTDFDGEYARSAYKNLIKLMAPIAPHFAEEMWERMGEGYSIFKTEFPKFDESALVKDEVEYPLQINGKLKTKFTVAADMSKEDVEAFVKANFADVFEGKQIVKFIVIPGRIVNVVVK